MTPRTILASVAVAVLLGANDAWSRRQQGAPCDVFCHAGLAMKAESAGNMAEYQRQVRIIASLAPSHPGVVFAVARSHMLDKRPDSAAAAIDRMARMGDARDPNDDSLFAPLRRRPDYVAARNQLLANRLPLLDGKLAFEIGDPDFTPEGIAYDSLRSRFIIGSLAKRLVAVVAPNGETTTLVPAHSEILRVVGIHVDAARNRLWFATWAPLSSAASSGGETPSITRLFLADPLTGRVVKSWAPDGARRGHLLNDFVVMNDGGLFITDTERGSIYRLRSPDDTLELFLQPDANRFSTANGITAAPDGRTLYVAFLEGIARVDVATRSFTILPAPDTISTAAIDGLYWYRGDLIAIQGIPTMSRVVRYRLSPTGDRIAAGQVLDRGLPVVQEPTTGVIVGSRFYYIANSQYGRLDDRSRLAPRTGPAVRSAIRVIDLR